MIRTVLFVIFSLLACITFGAGLLALNTTSEVNFGSQELMIFIGLPILFLIISIFVAKRRLLKIIGVIQIVAIILIARWFLMKVQNHPLFKWLDLF